MQLCVLLFTIVLSTTTAFTFFNECVQQCDSCLEFWGQQLFDARVCKIYCVLTQGGSGRVSRCSVGAIIQKRKKSHPGVMECQKYCAGCIDMYGKSFYDGYKCSVNCVDSKGKKTDTDCTVYASFGGR